MCSWSLDTQEFVSALGLITHQVCFKSPAMLNQEKQSELKSERKNSRDVRNQ